MNDSKNLIEKIGMGRLFVAVCVIVFFIFQPDVFHFIFVAAILLFPIYILIAKWLDKQ